MPVVQQETPKENATEMQPIDGPQIGPEPMDNQQFPSKSPEVQNTPLGDGEPSNVQEHLMGVMTSIEKMGSKWIVENENCDFSIIIPNQDVNHNPIADFLKVKSPKATESVRMSFTSNRTVFEPIEIADSENLESPNEVPETTSEVIVANEPMVIIPASIKIEPMSSDEILEMIYEALKKHTNLSKIVHIVTEAKCKENFKKEWKKNKGTIIKEFVKEKILNEDSIMGILNFSGDYSQVQLIEDSNRYRRALNLEKEKHSGSCDAAVASAVDLENGEFTFLSILI